MSFPQTMETVWINKADAFVVNKRLLSLANIHALFFIVMELHPVYVKGQERDSGNLALAFFKKY